jgi:hypothetical protein
MRKAASALAISLAAAALAPAGCASRKAADDEPVPLVEEPPRQKEPAPPDPPVQAGRYLVYQLKWLRAEEAAETLYPLFESRYGPGLKIVPHIPTNKLLIYVPSRREQEQLQGGGAGALPQTGQGVGQQRTAPQTGQTPTSRSRLGRSSRSTTSGSTSSTRGTQAP